MKTLENKVKYIKGRISKDNYLILSKFIYTFINEEANYRKVDRKSQEFLDLQKSRMEIFTNMFYLKLEKNLKLEYLDITGINNPSSISKMIERINENKTVEDYIPSFFLKEKK